MIGERFCSNRTKWGTRRHERLWPRPCEEEVTMTGSRKNRPAFPIFEPQGKRLFQQRSVKAFPLLVRQAKAEQIIFYSDLADELGMKLARNLNYVLGAIAGAVQKLGKKWNRRLPHLELLVVNKKTGIPGEGVIDFIPHSDEFSRATPAERKRIIGLALHDVFSFRDWDKCLSAFWASTVSTAITTAYVASYARFTGYGEWRGRRPQTVERLHCPKSTRNRTEGLQ